MNKPSVEQLHALCVEVMERQIANNVGFRQVRDMFPQITARMVKDFAAHVAMSVDCLIDDVNEGETADV